MDKNSDNDNSVPCPVCNRLYEKQNIEKHVNKCIFLNSMSENSSKREGSHLKDKTPLKRVKISPSSVSSTSKSEDVPSQFIPVSIKEETDSSTTSAPRQIPLAESMRPNTLEDFVGQTESFGKGSMLHSMLSKKKIPNMILWGPPGCGKTSIANVIAKICKDQNNLKFVKLSATMSGVKDVKDAIQIAINDAHFNKQTILFMDEIHRFNKSQQDTFLPHVENGTIILIGATTENPSFSLNNALLSRCKVVVLSKLSVDNVWQILERAVLRNNLAVVVDNMNENVNNELAANKCKIERKSIRWLAEICDGDARIALGALELALNACAPSSEQSTARIITLEDLKRGIKRSHILYDRQGEEHYNTVSAIHKSIRASDDNAALYWTTRALHAGEDPMYIARRFVRTAAEDIGISDPSALVEAVACLQGCKHIGMPECDVLLAHCAVRLARAEKSHEVYHAMMRVKRCLKDANGPLPPVPLHLRNASTRLLRDLGYGAGYNAMHRNQSGLSYMPEGLEHINFIHEHEDC